MEAITFLIDFILHIDVHLSELVNIYGLWIYAILFLIVFCETGLVVTPFLPGDSLLFIAGALAALGKMDVHTLVALLIIAAILGDTLNYHLGAWFGKKAFDRPHSRIFKRSHLEKTQAFYLRHGGKAIILARFVPIIRTFTPFVAGIGAMPYRQFIVYNVIGACAWVASFSYLGYFFGNLPMVKKNLSVLILVIIIVSLAPIVIEFIRQRRHGKPTPAASTHQ